GTLALGLGASYDNSTNEQRKNAMYNFLRNKTANGSNWEKMGTALIVHQMVKTPWGEGQRYIPLNDPVWADLKARLVDNPDLVIERYDYASVYNTIGVMANGQYDAVRYEFNSPWKQ